MTEAPVVRHQVVVAGTPERAFETFTQRLGEFKPPEHNLLGSPIASTVLEPRVGGHIVDTGEDGSECRWARVLAFEPPDRLVFSWDIGPTWQLEDPEHASEVELRFVADGPEQHPRGAGAPAPGPAWPRLARGTRGCRRRPGLAALPGAVRRSAGTS